MDVLRDDPPGKTFTAKFGEGLKRSVDRFSPAFGESLPYMALGLLIGSALLYLAHSMNPPVPGTDGHLIQPPATTLVSLIEHLAAGFFVSAIAVFFYEWGSHVKEAIKLADRLESFMQDSQKYVKHGLHDVLGENSEQIIAYHQRFIETIAELNRSRDWVRLGYIRFLTRFMEIAAENADKVRLLTRDLVEHPDHVRAYELDIPGPHVFADDMLAEQMKQLEPGDTYDTFSNLETWHVPLDKFNEAGKEAVARCGVTIRRLFVLGDAYHDEDARKLTRHYRATLPSSDGDRKIRKGETRGKYTILVTDKAYVCSLLNLTDRPHYGIFRHGDFSAIFEVLGEPNLHRFRLSAGKHSTTDNRLDADLQKKIRDFKHAWERVEKNDPLGGTNGFVDRVLAREARHLSEHGGTYFALTVASKAAGRPLPRVRRALANATRTIQVRRLIVLSGNAEHDAAVTQRFVQEAEHVGEPYEIKTLQAGSLSHIFESSFLTIRRGDQKMHPDTFNEDCDDVASDFLIEGDSLWYRDAFQEVWDHKDAASARQRPGVT